MSTPPSRSHSIMWIALLIAALVLGVGYQLIDTGSAVGAPPGPRPGPLVVPTNTPLIVAPTQSAPPPAQPPQAQPAPQIILQTPAAPESCGLITDFEQFGAWRRGNEPNGTFTQSAEQAHSGRFSARLSYSFPTPGNDYVVFMHTLPIGGRPAALTAWVYGDGAGHYLNVWVQDAGGEVWSFTFGRIRHVGWQEMVAPLNIVAPWPVGHVSGPDKGTLEYPLSVTALVLDDAPDTFVGAGAIYIDDLSCSETTPAVAGPAGGGTDRIAFVAVGASGSSEIFTINPDGTGLTQLTDNRGFDGSPAWSPDGSRILYQCCNDVNCATDLCVMNADGSDPHVVAQSVQDLPGQEARPAWSPDGSRIAYTGQNPQFRQETSIFIASADGSNAEWLTGGRNPSWSPDGSQIAFADTAGDPNVIEILATGVDGTNLRQVTQNGAGTSDFPAWSPEGARIAYCLHGKSLADDGLHVIYADGSGDRRVSPNCMWGLDWSPDGARLATSNFDSVLLLSADGGSAVALTKGREPSWLKPAGSYTPSPSQQPFGPIVFSSAFDTAAERPLNAGKSFLSGTMKLYAVWPYSGVTAGTPFRFEWYVNGAFWFSGEDVFKQNAGAVLADRLLAGRCAAAAGRLQPGHQGRRAVGPHGSGHHPESR